MNSPPDHDLIVVGAGPAGCSAAIRARQVGLSVLLLEADERLRPIPGETLHPGVESIFRQLGILEEIEAAGFHRHHGIWMETGSDRHFEPYGDDERGEWLGFQIDRVNLNAILRYAAVQRGATLRYIQAEVSPYLMEGQVCGIWMGSSKISARYVVDATGRQAWLAKSLELKMNTHSPPLWVKYGWRKDAQTELDGQPLFRSRNDGWDWIAPIDKDRTAWASLSAFPLNACVQPIAGIDVTWRIAKSCAGPGYFLLGDAAAILDPSSSHGVLRAFMSAIKAVQLIRSVKDGIIGIQSAAGLYTNWITEWFDADVDTLVTGQKFPHLFNRVKSAMPVAKL